MNLIYQTFDTFIEALFPTHPAEKWLLSMDIESILRSLPRAKNMPISEAVSIFSYKDERVWRMIWSIKYKKSQRATKVSAYALFNILKIYSSLVPEIIVLPMPVSKQRRRERGYNQCELLTNEIEKLSQNQNENKLIIVNNLLLRQKNTSRQTLKNRENRLANAHELFLVDETILNQIKISQPEILNSTCIIIDDVVTTGSTMKEAVHTMRNAGFVNTWGLSVAH